MNLQIKPWGLPLEFALEADESVLTAKGKVLYWQTQVKMWERLLFHVNHMTLQDVNSRVIYDGVTNTQRLYVGDVLVLESSNDTTFADALNRKIEYAHIKLVRAGSE